MSYRSTPPFNTLPAEARQILNEKLGIPGGSEPSLEYFKDPFKAKLNIWYATYDPFCYASDDKHPNGLAHPLLSIDGREDVRGEQPEEIKKIMDRVIAFRDALQKIGFEFDPYLSEADSRGYAYLLQKEVPVAQLSQEIDKVLELSQLLNAKEDDDKSN